MPTAKKPLPLTAKQLLRRIRPSRAGKVEYKGKVLPPIAGGASRDQEK